MAIWRAREGRLELPGEKVRWDFVLAMSILGVALAWVAWTIGF